MFVPPKYPTHLTSQMENVTFVNARMGAKRSSDPEQVAWYIGLTGNTALVEQFAQAKNRVDALIQSGWTLRGSYSRMETFISTRPELRERINENPTHFTCIGFFVDGEQRYFLLEAPFRN